MTTIRSVILAGGIALAGYFVSQTGVNSTRMQLEIQRQLQAEFLQQVQEAGMQVEQRVEPSTKG